MSEEKQAESCRMAAKKAFALRSSRDALRNGGSI